MKGTRARLPLAALLACAALVAGCGSDDGGADPQERVSSAFSPDGLGKLESGVISLTGGLSADDEGANATDGSVTLEGPFGPEGADLTVSLEGEGPAGEGVDFEGSIVATTDNFYVGWGDRVYELGTDRFKRFEQSAPDTPTPESSADYQELCKQQLEASGLDGSACADLDPDSWVPEFSDEGGEEIDGTETDHYGADLDIEAFIGDVIEFGFKAAPPEQLEGLPDPESISTIVSNFVEKARVDVYVGDDDIPRRVDLDLGFSILESATADVDLSATVTDVNQEQTIEAPADAVPIERLRSEIPGELRPVLDCFLDAEDVAALSACGAAVPAPTPAAQISSS